MKDFRVVGYSDNFLELESVQDANTVDLDVYTFVKYSETKNRYIFKRRQGK